MANIQPPTKNYRSQGKHGAYGFHRYSSYLDLFRPTLIPFFGKSLASIRYILKGLFSSKQMHIYSSTTPLPAFLKVQCGYLPPRLETFKSTVLPSKTKSAGVFSDLLGRDALYVRINQFSNSMPRIGLSVKTLLSRFICLTYQERLLQSELQYICRPLRVKGLVQNSHNIIRLYQGGY
jgi:hypothetical protein